VARDLLERFGQAVVHAVLGRLIGGHDRIDEAHRVAHVDLGRHLEPHQEAHEIEPGEIGRERGRLDAREVGPHDVGEAEPENSPQRIDDRAVEQSGAEARDQRIEIERRAARDLIAIGVGVERERRCRSARAIKLHRNVDRLAELLDILVVAEREILVEPFGGQRLGGNAGGAAAVGRGDRHAQHRLRRLGDRDDAEAERQPQFHVALEQLDALYLHLARIAGPHAVASINPCT
jgi:hypothetical protein